jgi:hypothetical protein
MKNLNPTERSAPVPEASRSNAAAPEPIEPAAAGAANPAALPDAKAIAKAAVAKAKEQAEELQTGVAQARDNLGLALRVLISNGVPDTDRGRMLVENAFEAAKLASAAGKATRADLSAAASGLQHAENQLANRTLKFPDDLATVRSALRQANNRLETLPE